MTPRNLYTLRWGGRVLELGRRTCIMGILNITPDSFSDGGRFFSAGNAVDQGKRLVDAGADILMWRGIHPPLFRPGLHRRRNPPGRAGH